MEDAVIVSACRTAIGRFGGGLAALKATDLGAHVVRHAVARAGLAPADPEEVILGTVLAAGQGLLSDEETPEAVMEKVRAAAKETLAQR